MGRSVPKGLGHTVFLLCPMPVHLTSASLVLRSVSRGLVLAELMSSPALVFLESAEFMVSLVL